jgi:S-ribosylhomocysteine lyase LuxS involved in autoinducer biosynthesis
VCHHPELVLGVGHQVLNGDLHLTWPTGVQDTLPETHTHTHTHTTAQLVRAHTHQQQPS